MKKTILNTAVATALSVGVMAPAQAAVDNFDFSGFFTILDSAGNALVNSSIPAKGNNQFQTPIVGTMRFDSTTGAGTAEIDPFEFFSGDPTLLATAVGINMQAIGNGMGGPGTLVLGNMLFNWNTNNGIPVSIVMDAAGFFTNGASAATPASDGIYVGAAVPNTGNGPGGFGGYLALGPVPMATTAWGTTDNCTAGVDCLNQGTSGTLPLVADSSASADYSNNVGSTAGTNGNGGSVMLDGPFAGSWPNFDITSLTYTGTDAGDTLATNCDFDNGTGFIQGCGGMPPEVPVPAAVWLFGSGLLGLVGVARRRKVS